VQCKPTIYIAQLYLSKITQVIYIKISLALINMLKLLSHAGNGILQRHLHGQMPNCKVHSVLLSSNLNVKNKFYINLCEDSDLHIKKVFCGNVGKCPSWRHQKVTHLFGWQQASDLDLPNGGHKLTAFTTIPRLFLHEMHNFRLTTTTCTEALPLWTNKFPIEQTYQQYTTLHTGASYNANFLAACCSLLR